MWYILRDGYTEDIDSLLLFPLIFVISFFVSFTFCF